MIHLYRNSDLGLAVRTEEIAMIVRMGDPHLGRALMAAAACLVMVSSASCSSKSQKPDLVSGDQVDALLDLKKESPADPVEILLDATGEELVDWNSLADSWEVESPDLALLDMELFDDVEAQDSDLNIYDELSDSCSLEPCNNVPSFELSLWMSATGLHPRNMIATAPDSFLLSAGEWGFHGQTSSIAFEGFDSWTTESPFGTCAMSVQLSKGPQWVKTVVMGGVAGGYYPTLQLFPDGDVLWTENWSTGWKDLPGPPLNLGGEPIYNHGYADFFVGRFDASGEHLWSIGYGTENNQVVWSAAIGDGGNVFVGGVYQSEGMDLGSGPLSPLDGGNHYYLLCLDGAGKPLWSFADEGEHFSSTHNVSAGSTPGALAVIVTSGDLTFGGVETKKIGYPVDFVFLRVLPDGQVAWVRRFGVPDAESGPIWPLAFGARGKWSSQGHYIYGHAASGNIDFGLGPLDESSDGTKLAAFLLRLDSQGNTVWARHVGDVGPMWGGSFGLEATRYYLRVGMVDSEDTLYLSGAYDGQPLDWPGVVPDNEEGYGYFLARFDVEGEAMWAVALNGLVASIAEGPDGTMYAYGSVKEDVLRVNEQEFDVPEGEGNKLFVLSFKP